jgi:hypothetical protein
VVGGGGVLHNESSKIIVTTQKRVCTNFLCVEITVEKLEFPNRAHKEKSREGQDRKRVIARHIIFKREKIAHRQP